MIEKPSGNLYGLTIAETVTQLSADVSATDTTFNLDAAFAVARGERMATFCLDAVDQAFAPGVSAPGGGGLEPRLWLHAAETAGRCPDVRSIDVVELNPRFDRDEQTARLAALTVWHFLRGVSQRES